MVVCFEFLSCRSTQLISLTTHRNGDHAYQFYQGGLRALNDPNAKHTAQAKIGSWLEPPTEGLDCDKDCCSMILNGDWCNQNCGGTTCRRGERSEHFALQPRATEQVNKVGGCALPYVLPNYPSAGAAAKISEIVKWYDRDDSVDGDNNCNNPRIKLFDSRLPGGTYDSMYSWTHLLSLISDRPQSRARLRKAPRQALPLLPNRRRASLQRRRRPVPTTGLTRHRLRASASRSRFPQP